MVTDSATPCSCGVERKFVVLKTSHGEDDLLADCDTFLCIIFISTCTTFHTVIIVLC